MRTPAIVRRVRKQVGKNNFAPAGLAFDLLSRVYRVDGQTFEIPRDMTTMAYRARFLFHEYEREERAMLHWLPADATVLELGGCLGVVSCLTNIRLADPARHIVVEANPRLVPWIERNRTRNGCSFEVEHCIVSNDADGTFYLHDWITSGSADRQTGRQITVPVKTVADIEAAHGVQLDALVMDIEGGELQFLRENPVLISRLRYAMLEIHEHVLSYEGGDECETIVAEGGLTKVGEDRQTSVWIRR